MKDSLFSVGLNRGKVSLAEYSNSWADVFEFENARLRLEIVRFQGILAHVGSTAVLGLPAKPIVDLALGLPDFKGLPALIAVLLDYGYEYHGYRRDSGGHILDRMVDGKVCFLLHVVKLNSFRWRMYLIVRDYLRHDRVAREKYAELKLQLADIYKGNRKAYTAAKRPFLVKLKREALLWHRRKRT